MVYYEESAESQGGILDDAGRVRLYSEAIQGIIAVVRLVVYATAIVLSIRYISGAFMAYAGKQSYADLSFALVTKLGMDRWFAYALGGGGMAYGWAERRLRKSNIKRMRGQTSEFELRMDPARTTSGLTPKGDTRRKIADMSDVEFVSAVFAGVCFLSILGLIRLVRGYQIDALRESLFSLRDEMFLYAYDNELIKNSAYQNLRFVINGFLRYSHKLSFAHIYFLSAAKKYLGLKLAKPKEMVQWEHAVSALPPDQAKIFQQFHSDAISLVIRHMIFRSPLLWIMLVGVILHLLIIREPQRLLESAIKQLKPKVRSDILEIEAMKYAHEAPVSIYAAA